MVFCWACSRAGRTVNSTTAPKAATPKRTPIVVLISAPVFTREWGRLYLPSYPTPGMLLETDHDDAELVTDIVTALKVHILLGTLLIALVVVPSVYSLVENKLARFHS